jgi:hypothetical protein
MTNTVFIHTNGKQIVGAIVSAHSLKRNSRNPADFDVKILRLRITHFSRTLRAKISAWRWRTWKMTTCNLYANTVYASRTHELFGRAIVIDPDVFAVVISMNSSTAA